MQPHYLDWSIDYTLGLMPMTRQPSHLYTLATSAPGLAMAFLEELYRFSATQQ